MISHGFEYTNVNPNGNNGIIVWNYKDSTGYQYPEETYSRNVYNIIQEDNIDKNNNVIMLKTPWNGGKIEKKTRVSQSRIGATYNYGVLGKETIGSQWQVYTNIITGESVREQPSTKQFRPGTKYVRFLLLMNWKDSSNTTIDVKDMIFSEIN